MFYQMRLREVALSQLFTEGGEKCTKPDAWTPGIKWRKGEIGWDKKNYVLSL